MREAIGGTWLFGIVILFIALFSAFVAYSVSYTKAFNTNNEIINIIERNAGFTTLKSGNSDIRSLSDEALQEDGSSEALIYYKIKKIGYNYTVAEGISCQTVYGNESSTMQAGGYCLAKVCKPLSNSDDNDTNSRYTTYYKVTTFIAINLPVVNVVAKIPISGETKSLYYDASGNIKNECNSIEP